MFKKINIFDLFVVTVIILAILGIILVRTGKSPITKVRGEEKEIEVDFIVRNLPLVDQNFIIPGEKAFIRIKNQPFAWVTVKDIKIYQKKQILPDFKGGYKTIDDINNPFNVDCLITFTAKGYVTSDSIVLGTKVKVGMSITIESYKADVTGVISAIRVK
ncbi:MAG: DUF4330 domain-containing protein [Dictyoglomus sp.]|nr:DUF4330 domain-containing protein [Dictyoglomus sp.]MCX7942299.1 DUF4330 domain-containing protein [Dictyoglomaceae bacterium]MDW8187875.1 DUF4330 domain-containing protein [Dictyoglomus sp.]